MALSQGRAMPDRVEGAALFADISGFTPLTEALVREFGPQRGAEELTRQLNQVYDALVSELHRYQGSVITFSGDAITCWFDEDSGILAATCALEMQEAMKRFAKITIPSPHRDGQAIQVSLAMKAAVAVGTARRFVVGDPKLQLMDVLAGTTLDRLAAGEHQANKGEVVLDQAAADALEGEVVVREWREDHETGEKYAVVEGLLGSVTMMFPEKEFTVTLPDEVIKDWLLPPVYERLRRGQGDFLAELRPAMALFVRFGGIDYDDDEKAGEKLDAYIRWAQNVLAAYDGYLLQLTVGDKGSYLMAAVGAPVAHEDDAVRAVSAALKLVQLPEALSYIQFVQIGIAMGRTRAGAYGGKARRTYGVMGDDVNLAARLMQAAPVGQILVSEPVREATGNVFSWEPLPPMRVKGKAEPVNVSRAVGLRPRRTFRLQVPEYKLPMVGRESHLAFLQETLAQTQTGKGQIVALIGEAGVGKTRLLAEVIRLSSEQKLVGLGGECESFGTETSYLVWQPIWRGFFGIDPAWSLGEQVRALETQLMQIDPGLVQRLPLLGAVLNLPIPDNDLTQSFDARLRKNSLEALLVDCLEARAQTTPLLIVLEDCQWIDSLSHDLLESLGRAVMALPVLFLTTMRPPEIERLQEARISKLPNYSEIRLHAFDTDEAKQLISLKLAQFEVMMRAFPQKITNRIIERAEGNPFYIEELLNYLFNQKDTELSLTLDLPTSLHSLILSRLDQLTESQKTTLKVASVIGRLFRVTLLWGAYPGLGEQARVQADLQALNQMQLTSLDPSEPELAYFFRQIVTQEVAYESLPFSTRATLHSQLAHSIEEEYPESIDQFVELLAFHYLRGQEWEKSLRYNLLAAQTAQREFANEAAMLACQRALDSASRLPDDRDTCQERITVHEILGDVQTLTGKYDDALENYATARVIVADLPRYSTQTCHLADLCRKISEVYERRSEYETAFEWLEKGLKYLNEEEPTVEAAKIYLLGAGVYHRQGKNHEAMSWSEKSWELASQIATREGQRVMAQTSYLQGAIHYRLGNLWGAVASCQKSVRLYEEIDEVPGRARALNNLAIAFNDLGNWEQASEAYHKGLEVNQQIGNIQEQGFIANNLATIHLDRGEWEDAAQLFKESNEIWKQLGAALPDAVTMSNLAQVHINQKNWHEAEKALQRSEKLFMEIGSDDYLPELKRRWGDYFLHTGQLVQALQYTQQSIELARTQEARLDEGMSYRVLGEIYQARGDSVSANTALLQSLDILIEMESEYEAAKTRLRLAQLWASQDVSKTQDLLQEVLNSFQKLGAKAELKEIEELYARLSESL
ncbi:MAG: tetratricopeptide repeat protein [Anaerolineales bacterium]|nr:tetratricopeptide repeat protein [Anaerolineales bacterium]